MISLNLSVQKNYQKRKQQNTCLSEFQILPFDMQYDGRIICNLWSFKRVYKAIQFLNLFYSIAYDVLLELSCKSVVNTVARVWGGNIPGKSTELGVSSIQVLPDTGGRDQVATLKNANGAQENFFSFPPSPFPILTTTSPRISQ